MCEGLMDGCEVFEQRFRACGYPVSPLTTSEAAFGSLSLRWCEVAGKLALESSHKILRSDRWSSEVSVSCCVSHFRQVVQAFEADSSESGCGSNSMKTIAQTRREGHSALPLLMPAQLTLLSSNKRAVALT